MTKTEIKLQRELEILRRSVVQMTTVFQSIVDTDKEVLKLISMMGKKMVQMDDKLNALLKEMVREKAGLIIKDGNKR